LASGVDSVEKEISVVDSETIIIIYEIIFFKLNRAFFIFRKNKKISLNIMERLIDICKSAET
jgi:hypothetical protein